MIQSADIIIGRFMCGIACLFSLTIAGKLALSEESENWGWFLFAAILFGSGAVSS